MKHLILSVLLTVLGSTAFANEIYINQIGDTLDLDIVQDGQDNTIGTATTDMTLSGDDMTFSITQTGNYNSIAATIKGSTYTGTWSFTGDNNAVDLQCSSAGAHVTGCLANLVRDFWRGLNFRLMVHRRFQPLLNPSKKLGQAPLRGDRFLYQRRSI